MQFLDYRSKDFVKISMKILSFCMDILEVLYCLNCVYWLDVYGKEKKGHNCFAFVCTDTIHTVHNTLHKKVFTELHACMFVYQY